MSDLEPITREEAAWINEGELTPITRKEQYIKHLYDETQVVPEKPLTREEWFINKAGEELHDVTIEQLNVSDNGTYSESGKAYSPVTVAVPLGTKSITANGTYNATDDSLKGYSSVSVDVPLPDNAYLKKDLPTGAIATVTDAEAEVMPSLKIAITPVQSGSGDPSPTNIRPISGWTGANVTRCGVNLFSPSSILQGTYDSTTNVWTINTPSTSDVLKFVFKPNTQYTFSGKAKQSAENRNMRFVVFYTDGSYDTLWASNLTDEIPFAVTSDEGKTISSVQARYSSYGGTITVTNFQIEVGTSASQYVAPNGTTYSIPFTDGTDPLTVYGGTLDVESGLLTVTGRAVQIKNLTWGYFSSRQFFNALPSTKSTASAVVCSCYKYGGAKGDAEMSDASTGIYIGYGASKEIKIKDTNYTDVATLLQDKGEYRIFYELATPTTYQLSPTAIKTLLNTNNIFADTGDILDGEYWSKNPLTVTRAMLNTLRDAGEVTEIASEKPEENADER